MPELTSEEFEFYGWGDENVKPKKETCDKQELNPREALFGFMGWLSTRKEVIHIGSCCDCAGLPDLIEEFSNANKFDEVEEGWDNILVRPDEGVE